MVRVRSFALTARLGYSTEDDANDNISFGIQDLRKDRKRPVPRITVRRRNQIHPLARHDDAVDNDRHGNKRKLSFYSVGKPL